MRTKDMAALFVLWSSQAFAADTESPSLSELFKFVNATIVSATKSEKKLKNAPSVITVWTEDDIKRSGLKSVKELLSRTVGFFNTRQWSNNVVGARGIIADGNEAFLMLIDGHNVNSMVLKGMGNEYIFPTLNNVKRVEIVRGPGSTLWGNDAALGIIHIITKSGSDINGLKISTMIEKSGDSSENSQNISYGKALSKTSEYVISFDSFAADGFKKGGNVNKFGDSNYENKDNVATRTYGPPWDMIKDSWQLFSKVNVEDLSFTARASDFASTMYWWADSYGDKSKQEFDATNTPTMRRKSSYFEISDKFTIDESSSLEAKIFTDYIEQTQVDMTNAHSEFDVVHKDTWSHEQARGLEFLFRHEQDELEYKLGLRYVDTEIEPVLDVIFHHPNTGVSDSIGSRVIPKSRDVLASVYGELEYLVKDDISLVSGVRADHNNLREKGIAIHPRFAAIYTINEENVLKYMFNTGYVRPPAAIGFLNQTPRKPESGRRLIGADKSEQVVSHDVQYIYINQQSSISLTGYFVSLKNFFNYHGYAWDRDANGALSSKRDWEQPDAGFTPGEGTFIINAGNVKSYGLELEERSKITNQLSVSLGLSYVISNKFDSFHFTNKNVPEELKGTLTHKDGSVIDENREMLAFPKKSWNAGIDYLLGAHFMANIGAYGLHDMKSKVSTNGTGAALYKNLDDAVFSDVSITYTDKISSALYSVNLFVKNIADNDAEIAFIGGGAWDAKGRSIGLDVSATF